MEKPENVSKTHEIDIDKLSGKQTFIYILGNIPQTILSGIFLLIYINYFWNYLKLQQTYFVIGQMIYMVLNASNDFFLGRLSDKTNVEKWGSRRLIYIKWGGPLWAILFFIMWFPWSYTNQIIIFLHFLITICAFDMFLTLVVITRMALLPELTESLNERNKIQFFNQIIASIGAIPVIIALTLFESSLELFQIFAGIMAVISAILYYIVGSKLHERPELYKTEKIPGLFKSIRETLKSRSFISYTGFAFFNMVNFYIGFSFVFVFLYIMFFDVFTSILLYYLITIIFGWTSYAIYIRLAKKVEMQKLIIRGELFALAVNIIGFTVVIQSGADIFIWAFLILGTLANGFLIFGFPYLMLVMDEDEIKYGNRREGMYLGMHTFFIKFSESLAAIVATTVLLYFGFVRNAPEQSPEAIYGIKFLFFIIPAIMMVLALLSVYFFPLKGEYLKQVREKLNTMHQKKAEDYKS
jgi:GPH family glycoside/pentoside/hexuronide:cation symporter